MGFLYSRYWRLAQRILPLVGVALYAICSAIAAKLLFPGLAVYARYALACVLVQVILLLVLVLGLIAGKATAIRAERRRRHVLDEIGDIFAEFCFGAPREPDLLRAAAVHRTEFLEVWEASLTNLRGAARHRAEELLVTTGLDQRLQLQLADDDPGQVLRAIGLLRKLENPPIEAIEKAVKHPAEVVRTAARITIARRGSVEAQQRILHDLPSLPLWQRIVLFEQIPADSPAIREYMHQAFQSADETIVLTALEFILSSQRLQPVSPARHLVLCRSTEVRIKFFKALPFMATDEDPVCLIRLGLADPDWRVRAMSARACGQLGVAALAPELVRLFTSATHAVEATHMVHALAQLDSDAWKRLQKFTLAENEMTRAVATEAIEKHLATAREYVV